MPAGAFSAARHMSVEDSFLDAGVGSINFKQLRGDQDFRPQGIHCNSSNDATENAAGYAQVRGTLYGENESFVDTYYVDIRRPVGLAFRTIYAAGTTARGIKLVSEQ